MEKETDGEKPFLNIKYLDQIASWVVNKTVYSNNLLLCWTQLNIVELQHFACLLVSQATS